MRSHSREPVGWMEDRCLESWYDCYHRDHPSPIETARTAYPWAAAPQQQAAHSKSFPLLSSHRVQQQQQEEEQASKDTCWNIAFGVDSHIQANVVSMH